MHHVLLDDVGTSTGNELRRKHGQDPLKYIYIYVYVMCICHVFMSYVHVDVYIYIYMYV